MALVHRPSGGGGGSGGGSLGFRGGGFGDGNFRPTRSGGPLSPTCDLNSSGCLSLANLLQTYSVLSEEHAWALCYQCAKSAKNLLSDSGKRAQCFLVTEPDEVYIHKDGSVHPDTFLAPNSSTTTRKLVSNNVNKLIANLAGVVFSALDFGLADDEERPLSAELESLLDAMASAGESAERPETDDEGIERDSGDSDDDRISPRTFNLDSVLEICARRLGSSSICLGTSVNGSGGNNGGSAAGTTIVNGGSNGSSGSNNGGSSPSSTPTADAHYKAVCRALVAEALELSSFLQKVAQGTQNFRQNTTSFSHSGLRQSLSPSHEHDPDLDKLNFTDWARLWVQVIHELRNGVKLKKVECSDRGPPIEYELTPYEILMDDIRSRRYKLNKVMVDGALPPRIKKDAHAIILEFIRSRPPLKKVTDRVLRPPPKKTPNPVELLMESIRQEHHLRPVKTNSRRKETHGQRGRGRRSLDNMTENNNGVGVAKDSSSNRGAVKTDSVFSNGTNQLAGGDQPQRRLIKADLDLLYSFDTKDDEDEEEEDDDRRRESGNKENGTSCFFGHICPEGTQSSPVTPWKKPSEPKFEQDESTKLKVDIRRRHSICNPTNREEHGSTMITFPFEYTNSVNVFSSLQCPRASPMLHRRKAKLPHSVSKSCLQEEFFQSNHWQTAIECLSLNLEEVVHIRNVLTKAELESLPVDCSLKEDVEKSKVCFLCLKTRFSLFLGPWGNVCKLCKRTVCAKCCEKMRIPTEHFAKVPVSTLSPNISPREEEKELPGGKTSPRLGLDNGNHSNGNTLPRKNSVGSAPTSPNLPRKATTATELAVTKPTGEHRSLSPSMGDGEDRDRFPGDNTNGPHSLPTVTSISLGLMAFKRRSFGRTKETEKTEKLKGSLMVVCHDCKVMVLQIIRSSRAKKAAAPTIRSNLTLDLTNSLKT